MTCWKPGMLAVMVREGPIRCVSSLHRGDGAHVPVKGSVLMVLRTEPSCGDNGQPLKCGCIDLFLDGGFHALASRFRPAVEDRDRCEDEFITLLKRSKPAPTQPHEVDVQVGGTREDNTLSHPSAAVAVEAAAMVSLDPVEISHTDRTEGVTHRDLSQHADSDRSNLNSFVPFHKDAN